uniref:Uncharacterized protein n=1 Tax=viral metagenome TaxID=1070528 RepID=A0A6M3IL93_9ZZZZ
MKRLDLTGQKFGRLTAIQIDENRHSGRIYWHCQCECGKRTIKSRQLLTTGQTTSCGCKLVDSARERFTTHGMSSSIEYFSWFHMKARCYKTYDKEYKNYGARGISVCARWLESFQNFFSDMGLKPSKKHEIERIDNDGDYSPENCKWATRTEQANNTRHNHFVTIGNKTQTIAQWSRELGIKNQTVRNRLYHGWTPRDALTRPVSISCQKRSTHF